MKRLKSGSGFRFLAGFGFNEYGSETPVQAEVMKTVNLCICLRKFN